jgi:hypothetical protein
MVKTKKIYNLPENNARGIFLLKNDVKIMKKFKGVNFEGFFRAHFSDFCPYNPSQKAYGLYTIYRCVKTNIFHLFK